MAGLAGSCIGLLRVRGAVGEASAVRLGLTSAFATGDLAPPGLPPAAILVLRSLTDPLPRRQPARWSGVRLDPGWEQAAREAVASRYRRARRPALGPVGASAEAVLFLDRAELIACLARDWCDGALAAWWWRALFRTADEAAAVLDAWRAAPQHAPAALHLLATWRRVRPFVTRLASSEAAALAIAAARAFSISLVLGPTCSIDAVAHDDRRERADEAPQAGHPARVEPSSAAAIHREMQTRYAPELARAGLAPAARLLAYVGLVLHRAPLSLARHALAEPVIGQILGARNEEETPRSSSTHIWTARQPEAIPAARETPALAPEGQESPASAPDPDPGVTSTAAADAGPRSSGAGDDEPDTPPAAALPCRPAEGVIHTAFGGAFYLINVAVACRLYGDFTTPARPGIDLPIWDFLRMFARRLLPPDEVDADPLASFLTQLAGRSDVDEPKAVGAADEEWMDWLAPFLTRRLARMLRVPEAEVPAVLLRRAARVTLSPAHLDVAFRLDEASIEVRLAGLDRDPGFVPAAGLCVAFTYD